MVQKRFRTLLSLGVPVLLLSAALLHVPLLSQPNERLTERYDAALKEIGQDQYPEAISQLKGILAENPSFQHAYRSLIDAFIYTDDLTAARSYFEDLLLKDPKNAYPYYALARLELEEGNYDAAIEKLKQSIQLDPHFAAPYSHYGGLPEVYRAKGDLDAGIAFFEEQIAADPQNPYPYFGQARCHIRKFEWEAALTLLDKALALEPNLLLAYHAKIYINYRLGRHKTASRLSQRLLSLARQSHDDEMVAYSAMMTGSLAFFRGDYLNALRLLHEALSTAKEIGDKKRESNCLNTIAATYAMTANFSRALQYFEQSLLMARKLGSKTREIQALNNIANVHKDRGNYQRALKIYAEALAQARANRFKYEETLALANMGEIYRVRKELARALACQKEALRIATAIEDKGQQGYILKNLGDVYLDLNDAPRAIRYLKRASAIGAEIRDLHVIWESETGLGACYEKRAQHRVAIQHFANAIAIYDSVRNTLDLDVLRDNFLEDKYLAYPSIVSLLARAGQVEQAFQFAEKYKAKTMLDILSRGKFLLREFLNDTLKTQLQQLISQHETAHQKLSVELAKANRDDAKIIDLDEEITDLELRKLALLAKLRKEHEQYYHLTTPQILTLAEIQKTLGEGQALLEYIVGAEAISAFVISKDTVACVRIAMGRTQLADHLAELSTIFDRPREIADSPAMPINSPHLADFTIPPAYSLYTILIKPLEAFLQHHDDLIIVPDDVLSYLPFELLVYDTSAVKTKYDFDHARFLLEKYIISYSSSASLLNPSLRPAWSANKGILAMGNPDFAASPAGLWTSKDAAADLQRNINLLPLPNSEIEVEAVGEVFNASDNSIYTGHDADEAVFKREAPGYSVIHLATHFLYNDDKPLYSKIVLARDAEGEEDGYLQTYEIFNMQLHANLAVLSACNSGLGKLRKGEGLISISRAFLFAGVPSTLLSLWNVDDRSTSEIMENFYRHLAAGLNKKRALQQAKLDYLNATESAGKDPFYWAPFVLTGDYGPVELPASHSQWRFVTAALFGLLLMALLVRLVYRRQKASPQT